MCSFAPRRRPGALAILVLHAVALLAVPLTQGLHGHLCDDVARWEAPRGATADGHAHEECAACGASIAPAFVRGDGPGYAPFVAITGHRLTNLDAPAPAGATSPPGLNPRAPPVG